MVVTVEVMLNDLHRFQLFEPGLLCDLVLAFVGVMLQMPHVGDVSDIPHLQTKMSEVSEKSVESDCRSSVSQMGVAVDGRTADIDPGVARMLEDVKSALYKRSRPTRPKRPVFPNVEEGKSEETGTPMPAY